MKKSFFTMENSLLKNKIIDFIGLYKKQEGVITLSITTFLKN